MSKQRDVERHSRPPAGNDALERRSVIAGLAAAGIADPIMFAVVALVQSLLRPEHSLVADPISALAAGPSGWVQDVNFLGFAHSPCASTRTFCPECKRAPPMASTRCFSEDSKGPFRSPCGHTAVKARTSGASDARWGQHKTRAFAGILAVPEVGLEPTRPFRGTGF